MRLKLYLSKYIKQLVFVWLITITSIASYAHSVAVFIEMGANNQVRFHVLSWHRPSEFGGRPSGAMFVNGTRYNFAAVNAAPIPSGYRLIASCSNWATNNNSRFAYQSTGWISGLNLCQTLNFNMTSNILETPACNLSGSLDLSVPLIVSQPSANTRLCQGNNFSATIAASGFNLSYQWQLSTNGGGSWTNITGNGYSGFNSTNLTYSGVTTSMNNYSYRCVVTSTIGDPCPKTTSINSNSLTIVVAAPTSITSQPVSSITTCNNTSQSIAVVASGTNLTYQWQYSTNQGVSYTNIGATSASLSFTAGSSFYTNGTYLRAFVNGTCGSVNSNATVLTVNTVTSVTNPNPSTICEGDNTSFSVTGTGTNLTYQWQVRPAGAAAFSNVTNTGVYTGATTNTLNVTSAPPSLNGARYRCIVSGACAPTSVTSGEASLIVNANPVIVTQPASQVTACAPAQASFSVSATGAGLTYSWQRSANGQNWTTITGNAAPYIVSQVGNNNVLTITSDNSMNGYQFRCVVSGTCSSPVISNVGTLNVSVPASITVQPSSLSPAICEASNGTLSFTATGTGLTYKWQVKGASANSYTDIQPSANYLNVNTNALNLVGITSSMDGASYKGIAMGTCGVAAETSVISLTVKGLPRTTNPVSSTVCMPASSAFNVSATGAGLVYQWQSSTSGASFVDLSDNQTYSGTTSNTLNIVTTGALDKTRYRLKLSGECSFNPVYSNPATLTVHSATNITTQPANKDVCIYGRVYITLVNAGLGNTYQWEEAAPNSNTWTPLSNSTNPVSGFKVSGVTTDSLMLSSVPFEKDGYRYRCVITSNCPSTNTRTTSNESVLSVLRKPSITVQPVNANNNLNVQNILNLTDINTATYIFNTTATGKFNDGATPNIFQWWQSTNGGASWTAIADGSSSAGGNSYVETTTTTPAYRSTLSVTIPKGSIQDKTKYLFRCLVNGVCDLTTTRVVSINPPPKINR